MKKIHVREDGLEEGNHLQKINNAIKVHSCDLTLLPDHDNQNRRLIGS